MTTYAQIKEEGKQEGILEGEQKGKVEGKIEVILNGLKNGLNVELLANITGLTVAEVEKITKEHGKE